MAPLPGSDHCILPIGQFPYRKDQGLLRRILPRNERNTNRDTLEIPDPSKRRRWPFPEVPPLFDPCSTSPFSERALISTKASAGIETSRSPEWLVRAYSPATPGSPSYVIRPPPEFTSTDDPVTL